MCIYCFSRMNFSYPPLSLSVVLSYFLSLTFLFPLYLLPVLSFRLPHAFFLSCSHFLSSSFSPFALSHFLFFSLCNLSFPVTQFYYCIYSLHTRSVFSASRFLSVSLSLSLSSFFALSLFFFHTI